VAICAVVSRPGIHAVPIRSAKQQSLQSVHRLRERLIHERTAKSNQIKSMVAEEDFIFLVNHIQLKQAIVALGYNSDVRITLLLRRPGSICLEQLTALQQWVERT
jgi:transposase